MFHRFMFDNSSMILIRYSLTADVTEIDPHQAVVYVTKPTYHMRK